MKKYTKATIYRIILEASSFSVPPGSPNKVTHRCSNDHDHPSGLVTVRVTPKISPHSIYYEEKYSISKLQKYCVILLLHLVTTMSSRWRSGGPYPCLTCLFFICTRLQGDSVGILSGLCSWLLAFSGMDRKAQLPAMKASMGRWLLVASCFSLCSKIADALPSRFEALNVGCTSFPELHGHVGSWGASPRLFPLSNHFRHDLLRQQLETTTCRIWLGSIPPSPFKLHTFFNLCLIPSSSSPRRLRLPTLIFRIGIPITEWYYDVWLMTKQMLRP